MTIWSHVAQGELTFCVYHISITDHNGSGLMDISTLPKPIQGRFLILLWPNTGPVALHQMSRLSHKTTCGWKGQHWSWEGKPSPSRANAWQKTKAAIADSLLPPSTFTQPLDVIEQANSFHRVPVSSTWLFLEISFTSARGLQGLQRHTWQQICFLPGLPRASQL